MKLGISTLIKSLNGLLRIRKALVVNAGCFMQLDKLFLMLWLLQIKHITESFWECSAAKDILQTTGSCMTCYSCSFLKFIHNF